MKEALQGVLQETLQEKSQEALQETLVERQNKIVQEFVPIKNWEDRYKKIIEMGKALPELPESLRTKEALVKGCQSQVWLHAHKGTRPEEKELIFFQGDSDALIVKGLVALLLRLYSGAKAEEILSTPPDFIKEIGFQHSLSPSRNNGLLAMVKQIRYFATAYMMIEKSNK